MYNTNAISGNPNVEPVFSVRTPIIIRAAGLTQCVPIYMMVGDCPTCRPEDILWAPVLCCGTPVELCADITQVVITTPGRYSLGLPSAAPLVLAGDVNITKQEGVDPSLLGKECACADSTGGGAGGGPIGTPADPIFVDILSTCADPVFVSVCTPLVPPSVTGIDCAGLPVVVAGPHVVQTVPAPGTVQLVRNCDPDPGIEIGFAPLGCTFDVAGDLTGKVYTAETRDDVVGSPSTYRLVQVLTTGVVVDPYVGTWDICEGETTNQVGQSVLGCAAGVPWWQTNRGEYSSTTGALVSGEILWIDSTGTVSLVPPVGFTLGACPTTCLDPMFVQNVGELVEEFNVTVLGVCSTVYRVTDCDGIVTWELPTGAAYVPTGTELRGSCALAEAFDATEIVETGCALTVPFSRITTTTYLDGVPTETVVYRDSVGVDVIVMPVGFTLGACSITPDRMIDITVEDGCATGVSVSRVTRTIFDMDTGLIVSTTVSFRDSAGVETLVAPVGFTLGACPWVDLPDIAPAGFVEVNAPGATAAGLASVTFTNVGNLPATVLGTPLLPGETITWNAYRDSAATPSDGVFFRLPAIAYDGTGTRLHIVTLG